MKFCVTNKCMGPRYGVDVLKAGKIGNAQMKAIDVCFVDFGEAI